MCRAATIQRECQQLAHAVMAFRAAGDRAITAGVAFADVLADTVAEETELAASYAVRSESGWVLTAASGQIRLTAGSMTIEHAIALAEHISAGWLGEVAAYLSDRGAQATRAATLLADAAADLSTALAPESR